MLAYLGRAHPLEACGLCYFFFRENFLVKLPDCNLYRLTNNLTPDHSSKLWFNARGAPRVIRAQAGAINTSKTRKDIRLPCVNSHILPVLIHPSCTKDVKDCPNSI